MDDEKYPVAPDTVPTVFGGLAPVENDAVQWVGEQWVGEQENGGRTKSSLAG